MKRTLVMTIIGQDRPGLVEAVAAQVVGHGGNWLESRMARLGGQFAGILSVEVPIDQANALVSSLRQLSAKGLEVQVSTDQAPPAGPAATINTLEIVGQDRPGIVSQISRVLATYGVNVEELETECSSAAMSGETLFQARARLSIPETCDKAALRKELEKIAADMIVDISLIDLPAA